MEFLVTGRVDVVDIRGGESDFSVIVHGEVRRQPLEAPGYKLGVGILKLWRLQNCGGVRA